MLDFSNTVQVPEQPSYGCLMPPPEAAATSAPLRRRRRAVAVQEILSAAECHIAEHGPHALSLRAIARSLEMTVQALYHYFPSRDDLVTALVTKAYDDLVNAVQEAVDTPPDDTAVPRFALAAEGYRGWAVANPERFQLIYGTPLRHYRAPTPGPTTRAVRRMSAIFHRELFDGFTAAQLDAANIPVLSPPLREHFEHLPRNGLGALPPAATALLLSAWGHMHGLVTLEVFGHTTFIGPHQAEIFHMAMCTMVEDIHRRIPAAGPATP